MSQVFDAYARYYDLLYRDKDYVAEAEYVAAHIRKHAPGASRILELGSGTGKHAALLAECGYSVHGVDMSLEMLTLANERLTSLPKDISDRLRFSQGDICNIEIGEQFDAAIALFHVVSYQTSNKALRQTIKTVKHHLKPGGFFLFDVWYGPAVLSDPPTVKIKRMENEEIQITRIAEPQIDMNKNTVRVNYQVFIRNKESDRVEEISEVHKVRYLFRPELDLLFEQHGFNIVMGEEWMTGKKPGPDTWGVCFLSNNIS